MSEEDTNPLGKQIERDMRYLGSSGSCGMTREEMGAEISRIARSDELWRMMQDIENKLSRELPMMPWDDFFYERAKQAVDVYRVVSFVARCNAYDASVIDRVHELLTGAERDIRGFSSAYPASPPLDDRLQ